MTDAEKLPVGRGVRQGVDGGQVPTPNPCAAPPLMGVRYQPPTPAPLLPPAQRWRGILDLRPGPVGHVAGLSGSGEVCLRIVLLRGGMSLVCPSLGRHAAFLAGCVVFGGHPGDMPPLKRSSGRHASHMAAIKTTCLPAGGHGREMAPAGGVGGWCLTPLNPCRCWGLVPDPPQPCIQRSRWPCHPTTPSLPERLVRVAKQEDRTFGEVWCPRKACPRERPVRVAKQEDRTFAWV